MPSSCNRGSVLIMATAAGGSSRIDSRRRRSLPWPERAARHWRSPLWIWFPRTAIALSDIQESILLHAVVDACPVATAQGGSHMAFELPDDQVGHRVGGARDGPAHVTGGLLPTGQRKCGTSRTRSGGERRGWSAALARCHPSRRPSSAAITVMSLSFKG